MDGPLGLIAGHGEFPLEIARVARARGLRVHAIGFHAVTPPALAAAVDEMDWLHFGELERLLETFRSAGVCEVVMAGKVHKRHLFDDPAAHRPDATALSLIAGMRDRQDDSILDVLAEWLASEGFRLRGQGELAPELLAPVGVLGAAMPSPRALADIDIGWPLAMSIAELGVGQCIVVNALTVVAVEAMEGTDETILRAGRLAGPGATVIKVPRSTQDLRNDLPAIGEGTLAAMAKAGAEALVYAAEQTILLGRRLLIEAADRADVALLGVDTRSGRVGPDRPS